MTLRETRNARYDAAPTGDRLRMGDVMRVAIYCRVSSTDQVDHGTIASQRHTLTRYAERRGFTVVGVFEDDGKSATSGPGKLEARDAWHKVVALMKRGAVHAVLVVDQDRLTRAEDLQEAMEVIGTFQRTAVLIMTESSALDLTTPEGRLQAMLNVWKASGEASSILRRTQTGKDRVCAEGGKPAGRTPYGLRYDKHEKRKAPADRWRVDAEEAKIIREIARRVADRESCDRIALDLQRRGVPPPAKRWNNSLVASFIRMARFRYAGRWRANQHKDQWCIVPRILSDAEIAAAEAGLSANARTPLCARTRHVYILDRSAASCRCGDRIGIFGQGGKVYYACRSRRMPVGSPGRCTVGIAGAHVPTVDERLWTEVTALIATPGIVKQAMRDVAKQGTKPQIETRKALDKARAKLAELNELAEVILAGAEQFGAAGVKAKIAKLTADRKREQERVRELEAAAHETADPASLTVASVEAALAGVRELAAKAKPEKRRSVARSLLGKVEFLDEELVAEVNLPLAHPAMGSCSIRHSRMYLGKVRVSLARPATPNRGAFTPERARAARASVKRRHPVKRGKGGA